MAHNETTKQRLKRKEDLRRQISEAATPEYRASAGDEVFTRTNRLADLLLRRASRHHTLCENECNREVTPREQRECENLERNIAAALAEVNPAIVVKCEGDPRGFTIKIHFPAVDGRKPHNTWGGEETGYGI